MGRIIEGTGLYRRLPFPLGWPGLFPNCAQLFYPPTGTPRRASNPASTFLLCAFCEQEGHLAAPSHSSATVRCVSKGSHHAIPCVSSS